MIGFTLDEIIGSVFYAICYGCIFSLVEFLLTLSYKIFAKVAYQLTEKFKKVKNGKGIAYTIPLDSMVGVAMYQLLSDDRTIKEGGKK